MTGKKIYILGICGTFTAQVGKLALDLGFDVSGCDRAFYPPMSEVLNKLNIRIDIGFNLENLNNQKIDYFIVGNAISRGNPILEHILDQKLPFYSASGWIREYVLKNRKVIAISGTHGKTTTTAMICDIFQKNGIDCGYLVAGSMIGYQNNAHLGKGEFFVIEADEYDSAFNEKYPKFMHYHPDILIINNLEFDHADIYANLKEIQTHFHYLLRTLAKSTKVIIPDHYHSIEQVLKQGFYSKKLTFVALKNQKTHLNLKTNQLGFKLKNNRANKIEFYFIEQKKIVSETLCWIENSLSSRHNAKNAAAAILTSLSIGLSLKQSISALSQFKGVSRRMELKFANHSLKIFADFAHHPTAIKSTLKALRINHKSKKILAIFDPASNTMKKGVHSAKKLAKSFHPVDVVWFYQPTNSKIDTKKIASLCINQTKCFNETDLIYQSVIQNHSFFDIIIIISNASFGGITEKIISKLQDE